MYKKTSSRANAQDPDLKTRCCIVGGGPAGIVLGYLLARSGIETTVLEKYPDFFRDFRGDTIHPSAMEILAELDLLDEFLKLNPNKTYQLEAYIGPHKITLADFSHLKVRCPFIAFIPQWDFLNFIVKKAHQFPSFHLLMNTAAIGLIEEDNEVVGVYAKGKDSTFEIKADLVIGADGRHSTVREKSGLLSQKFGAPMDVLWFALPRKSTDPKQSLGKIDMGKMMVLLDRDAYWQCGFLIRKGDYEKIHQAGLPAFRQSIIEIAPIFTDRVNDITSWEQVKLLEVRVDRLNRWYRPGLLCIGDSAHAMSPIGGVGINLAIQDAVASANVLVKAMHRGKIIEAELDKIQKRRQFPTQVIQSLQVFIQNRVINKVLGSHVQTPVPFIFKMLNWFPVLRRIPAYLVGIGIRPEHVQTIEEKNH